MGAHRYWRVQCSAGTYKPGDYMGCAELKLKDTAGGTNRAALNTGFASVDLYGIHPSIAFDGDPSTLWTTTAVSPPSGGHYLGADFGAGITWDIVEVEYQVRADTYREDPKALSIQFSDDGTTYTEKWNTGAISTWTAGQNRVFSYSAAIGRRRQLIN